jgi:hypothetical protein
MHERRFAHGNPTYPDDPEVDTTMQYLLLIYSPVEGGPSPEEAAAEYPRWMQYTEDLKSSGVFVAGEALQDGATATTVRVRGGQRNATDGPFAETKELLGGFYMVDVPDLDAALELAAKMPNIEYGSVEVRPVMVFDMAQAG